jgi:hypothetical protein
MLGIMRIRPVHIWWLGVGLFTPSILIWVWFLGIFIYKGMISVSSFSLDWYNVSHLYLPLLAAVVGFTVPVLFLRILRQASWRITGWAFAGFLAVMLTWGFFDIKAEHYQIGGHDYPHGILEDGHRYYWHLYFTWYFLPYRWIHGYHFD